ncbi:6935_t:CDS:2 [Cetraspora pellucida]|uniref:6935_t:CDS:1 n=1 Tax=Cetraspora pellucida TaxID=1433469 RepID=A0A9N9EW09_9GLOM|nr:6935_t:CDS:2 [Cetraspora pellucida]
MPKSKLKNAAKEYILTQSRNSDEKFSKSTVTENSDPEYSDQKYSDPELLVFESENSNKEKFNNKKTELNKEARQLIYKNNLQKAAQGSMSLDNFFKLIKKLKIEYEMLDSDISDLDIKNDSSSLKQLYKLNNKLKDIKNINAYEYLCLLTVHKYLTAIFNNYEEFQSYIKLSFEISQQVFQHGL